MKNKKIFWLKDRLEKPKRLLNCVHSIQNSMLLIFLGVLLFISATVIGFLIIEDDKSFFANIYTTFIGMIVTVFIIDQFAKQRDENNEKQSLIFQLGSPNESVATEAARLLRLRGWHNDGSLIGASLNGANLHGAILFDFVLNDSQLNGAILKGANLHRAQLNGTRLVGVDFTDAFMEKVSMRHAIVTRAIFHGANLSDVDDSGVSWETVKKPPDLLNSVVLPSQTKK